MIVVTSEVYVSICGPRRGLIYSNHYKDETELQSVQRLRIVNPVKEIRRGSIPSRRSTFKRNLENLNRKQYSKG